VKVRYTRRALRQLAEILDYIEARSPQGADNVKRRLQAVVDLLAGIRRVVARPYPYVVFSRPDTTGIVIHGIRHAARGPP